MVAEVEPLSQGAAAPAAQTCGEAPTSTSAPHAPQWLENDRKASAECPSALSNANLLGWANIAKKDRGQVAGRRAPLAAHV